MLVHISLIKGFSTKYCRARSKATAHFKSSTDKNKTNSIIKWVNLLPPMDSYSSFFFIAEMNGEYNIMPL